MGHGVQQQLRALDDDLLTHLDEDFARRRRDKVWCGRRVNFLIDGRFQCQQRSRIFFFFFFFGCGWGPCFFFKDVFFFFGDIVFVFKAPPL